VEKITKVIAENESQLGEEEVNDHVGYLLELMGCS
jgi:hypothetical protein